MPVKLSQRKRLILALLEVYGPQPLRNLLKIVYPGQEAFFSSQINYLLRAMNDLETKGLTKRVATDLRGCMWETWEITEEGRHLQ